MSNTRIQIKRMKVGKLLASVQEGHFAIPKLQREFVWDGPKAAKLFDSLLHHMPVGLVMVWSTPRSHRLYLRQKYHVLPTFNDRLARVWFLIDGQQRVSALHQVREGGCLKNAKGREIDFRRVVFALDAAEDEARILYRKPVSGQYVPVSDMVHPAWKSRLKHLGKRKLGRVEHCRRRILDYPMHLMFVEAGLDTIRETFLRINTQGMKIGTADAIFTQAEELDMRDIRHEVNAQVAEGFGQIPEMPVLFAMAAIRGAREATGSVLKPFVARLQREAQSDGRKRKQLARDWGRLASCFAKAVDYLRGNFHVISREYLYSDYLVTMLALFLYWGGSGPSSRQKEQIHRWFWATTVCSRYSGRAFFSSLRGDLDFFRKLAGGKRVSFRFDALADRGIVRRASYASSGAGITIAVYCLLLARRPVYLTENGLNEIPQVEYARANRKNRHHIFPRAYLAKLGIPPARYNSIANICLLTAEENQGIGAKPPRLYLGEIQAEKGFFAKKMARHLIPVNPGSGVWDRDARRGFARFLPERVDLICKELEQVAGIRLFLRKET